MERVGDPERFAEILTNEIKALATHERVNVSIIQGELGVEIGHKSGASIERWRTKRVLPAKYQDLEKLAVALKKQGRLQGALYDEFLEVGGHPFSAKKINGPEPAKYFTGREGEIEEVVTTLQSKKDVTIWGAGGIGKSAIVAEAIKRLAPNNKLPAQFPDGIFYHDFYRISSADIAIEQIVRFFSTELQPTTYLTAQKALSTKQALLIFDGAEAADNLRKLLEIRGKCTVLIVTRDNLVTHGKIIEIEVLPIEQAINLLQAWSKKEENLSKFQVWSNDSKTDYANAKKICELIGQLPLALRLAGMYMLRCKTKALNYLEILQETPLPTLQGETLQHDSVLILLEQSLEKASKNVPYVKEVMAVIGLLSFAPFTAETIALGLDLKKGVTIVALNALMRYGMLKWVSGEYYHVIHRLIQEYARNLTTTDETIIRLASYYTSLAKEKLHSEQEGYAKLDMELPHILAILSICFNREKWAEVLNLAWPTYDFLADQGYWLKLVAVSEMGLTAAHALRKDEFDWLNNSGYVYHHLLNSEQAKIYNLQALENAQNTGNQADEYIALYNLGLTYKNLDEDEYAGDCLKKALAISQKIGHQEAAKNILTALDALAYKYIDPLTLELENLPLETCGNLLTQIFKANTNELGIVESSEIRTKVEQIIKIIQEALSSFTIRKDRSGQWFTLLGLAQAHSLLDHYNHTRDCVLQIIEIYSNIEHSDLRDSTFWMLLNFATQNMAQNRMEFAHFYVQQALKMDKNFKNLKILYELLGTNMDLNMTQVTPMTLIQHISEMSIKDVKSF